MDSETSQNATPPSPTASALPTLPQPLPSSLHTSASDIASITTSDLALSWISSEPAQHPPVESAPVFEELRARWKRFEEKRGTGEEDEDELLSRTGLEWDIPDNLEELELEQLSVLPLHPSFTDSLIEPARTMFHTRNLSKADPSPAAASSLPTVKKVATAASPGAIDDEDETIPIAGDDTEVEMQEEASAASKCTMPVSLSPPSEAIDPGTTLVDADEGGKPTLTEDEGISEIIRETDNRDPDATLLDPHEDDKPAATNDQAVDNFFDGLEVGLAVMKAMKGNTPVDAEASASEVSMEAPPTPPSEHLPHIGPSFIRPEGTSARELEREVNRSHSPQPRKGRKKEKKRSTPYSRPSHAPPSRDSASFVPSSVTRTWTTIFVSNVSYTLSEAQVWDLLSSSPRLPRPVAIRLVRAGRTRWWLCFVAYANPEEAHLAGLAIPSVETGIEGTRLASNATDQPPEAYDWRWNSTSEEYQRRYESSRVGLTQPDQPTGRLAQWYKQGKFRTPSSADAHSGPFQSPPHLPDIQHDLSSPTGGLSPPLPSDPVPLRLLKDCQSIFLDNLPLDVSLSDLSAYLPADAVIGISLNNPFDPTFRTYKSRDAHGSAFLLFANSTTAGDIADRAFSRQTFPGGKMQMWWQRKHKPSPWVWSAMSRAWAAANGGPLVASPSTDVGTAADTSIELAPRDQAEKEQDDEARKDAWGRSKKLRREAESLREHRYQQDRHLQQQSNRRSNDRYLSRDRSSQPYPSSSSSYPYPSQPTHHRDRHSSYRDLQEPPSSHAYSSYAESSSSRSSHYQQQPDHSSSPRYGSQHSYRTLPPQPHHSHSRRYSYEHNGSFFVDSYAGGPPNPRQYDGYVPPSYSSSSPSSRRRSEQRYEDEYRRGSEYR